MWPFKKVAAAHGVFRRCLTPFSSRLRPHGQKPYSIFIILKDRFTPIIA